MVVIPTNNRPNPMMILEISFVDRLVPVNMITTPMMMASGARLAGLKNFAHSTLETNHPVTVVPIFAPIITPMA